MRSYRQLQEDNRALQARLEEAEDILRAIRNGEADALLIDEDDEPKVYTLKGAERPYRLLVENMLDAAVLLSQGGAILFANRSFASLLGVEPEHLPGEAFGKFLSESSTSRWIEMMSGERARAHLMVRRPADGLEIPVRVAFNALEFNGQQFRSALLTDLRPVARAAQQLAHQSAARAKAEDLAERLVLALEAADLGTYEWLSLHGPIVWSPEVERMFGLEPASFAGTAEAWLASVHPDDRREAARKAIEAFHLGDYRHEYRCVRSDGSCRWISAHGTIVSDAEQPRLIGIMQDVTERREAHEQIKASAARFRALADGLPNIIWETDASGSTTYLNEHWYRYSGLTPEESLGSGWLTTLTPEDAVAVQARWRAICDTGEPAEVEVRYRRHDGEYRAHLVRAIPLRDQAGKLFAWVGSSVDIEEIRQLECELREGGRRKDEFLAMLAHELRNPLAPIRNSVEFLKCVVSGDENLARARDIIGRQVRHLTRLVDDLLDVSRITRGVISLQLAPVTVAEVVDAAMEAAHPMIDANEHSVSIDLGPELLRVNGDSARLCQVLGNLLTNAAKFTPRAGHIAITSYRDGEMAFLSVRDTGVGIPKDQQPRVFDLFAQELSSVERSQGGLGIGLTLAKRIIELHGGHIELRSEGRNKGSEFVLRLPALAAVGDVRAAETAALQPTEHGGLRVLVVEDNLDAAESFRMLLELGGHEVRVVNDGLAALRMVSGFRADVAFIDLGLPGIDGFELATRLRGQQSMEPTFLIALSGYGQEEDKVRAKEAGFDSHLTKPVDFATIQRVLNARKSAAPGKSPSATVH